MALHARTSQSTNNTPSAQAVQDFAMQNANDPNQSTVMSVLVDDTKAQMHRRKTDLERYYQDQSIQSTEIEVLGTEREQLLAVLKELDPSAASRKWSLEDFQKAVQKTKREWEDKDRMFSGKPQKFFHKIIGKFGAHAKLFKLVPQQTNYTSLVTGAATILVSASVQHVDTIEELARVLDIIDESAAACDIEGGMYQSEAMQRAVAKFYIAVFLLLGDVAMWYKSSAWKKIRNSLHEGFAQRFEGALQNIVQLSNNIRRVADQGANAELRVTRLSVEELRIELSDTRAGLVGGLRTLAQQNWELTRELLRHQQRMADQSKLDHEETRRAVTESMRQLMRSNTFREEIARNALPLLKEDFNSIVGSGQPQLLLQGSGETSEDKKLLTELVEHGVRSLPEMRSKSGMVKIRDVQEYAVSLLDYVQTGAASMSLSDEQTPVFFDRRVVMALEEWLDAKRSRLLYLESPSYISAAAMRVVLSADSISIPCISFFCEAEEADMESEVQTREVDPLLGLVYSLIYQILNLLPPLTEQDIILSHERFTDVNGTLASWDRAMDLLVDSLKLSPKLMLCVVDGILRFEEEHEEQVADFVGILRKQMAVEGKVLKILFTSAYMVSSLTSDLDTDEMEIVEIGRHGGIGRGVGQIAFVPGSEEADYSD